MRGVLLAQVQSNSFSIHSIIEGSEANGPGSRLTIWTQGCSKGCKGCFNPETWKISGGEEWHPIRLANWVADKNPEGITLTGGDPLEQPVALLRFLRELVYLDAIPPRGIIMFSGYTIEELSPDSVEMQCISLVDLLIDGRYVESLRYTDGLAGSSNQRFHFSSTPGRGRDLISEEEIRTDQMIELHTRSDGVIEVTGFPSIDRRLLLKLGLKVLP